MSQQIFLSPLSYMNGDNRPQALIELQKNVVQQSIAPLYNRFAVQAAVAADAVTFAAADALALYFSQGDSLKINMILTVAFAAVSYHLMGRRNINDDQNKFVDSKWRQFSEEWVACRQSFAALAGKLEEHVSKNYPKDKPIRLDPLPVVTLGPELRDNLKWHARKAGFECTVTRQACRTIARFIPSKLSSRRPRL